MYFYHFNQLGQIVVGCKQPDGQFFMESVFDSRNAAAERVNFLNGQIVGNISNERPMIQFSDN